MKTQFEKDAAFKRARAIIDEAGYNDGYGHETPSKIKQRLDNQNKRHLFTYYKGQHEDLWGQDLSGEDLLKLAYGDK